MSPRTMPPAKPRLPRPHQVPAIEAAVTGLKKHSRVQVIMACGTGKTLVAQRIAEQVASGDADSVLVLFPNLGLLDQNARAFQEYRERDFTALAVCSSDQIGRKKKANAADDLQLAAEDLSIPSTTKSETLGSWLRSTPGLKIVFATYQSTKVIAEMHAANPNIESWSLAMCDEAHRTAGPNSGLFSTILDNALIPCRRRLFLTATPRIHKLGKGDRDGDIVSMDDVDLYGPRVHELSFKQASDAGILSRYKLLVVGVDDAMIDRLIRRNPRFAVDGLAEGIGTAEATALIAITVAANREKLHRLLAYHNAIGHSTLFARRLAALEPVLPSDSKPSGKLTVHHVDGATKPGVREAAINDLEGTRTVDGDWTVVSNVKCLTEGIDVPTLDGVVACEPRKSAIDVVQILGRAIRPNPERNAPSVVLLPIYVPPGEDPEEVAANCNFTSVIETMNAMRDQDETLDAWFDHMAEPWALTYAKVLDYTDAHSTVPTDSDDDPEVARLGRWTVRQALAVERDSAQTGAADRTLTGPQVDRLIALPGFDQIDVASLDRDWKSNGGIVEVDAPVQFNLPDDVGFDFADRLAGAIRLHVVRDLADGFYLWAHDCAAWVRDENGGRLPRTSGKRPDPEMKHGTKLSHARRAAKLGYGRIGWTRDREQIMDEAFADIPGGWRGDDQQALFAAWAIECASWCVTANNGRTPRMGDVGDDVERQHGQKLHKVRVAANMGSGRRFWSPEREAIMDAAFANITGGWRGESFSDWATECATWCVDENGGRLPRTSGADGPVERRHGQKLGDFRKAAKSKSRGWSPEREAIMDGAFAQIEGGWRGENFTDWVKECAAWCINQNEGRLPRTSRVSDPVEKAHGTKLSNTRTAAKKGYGKLGWSPEREALMDEMFGPLGGWRGRAS